MFYGEREKNVTTGNKTNKNEQWIKNFILMNIDSKIKWIHVYLKVKSLTSI